LIVSQAETSPMLIDKDHPMFHPNPDVLIQRLGQEMILLHLRTNRFYELNCTGSRLWELLVLGYSRSRVEKEMLREFDVEPGLLAKEIDDLLAALTAENLVSAHAESD
jgi:hypothetical protein